MKEECTTVVNNTRGGFTITEVVVASAVLAIVFLALLGALSTASRNQAHIENRLESLHYAREILDQFSRVSYSSAAFSVGTKQLPDNRGYCVITQDGSGDNKTVTVVVNWTETWGKTQSVAVSTSFCRSLHK